MLKSIARVTTERPARYGKQLVDDLAGQAQSNWDDGAEEGKLTFTDDTAYVRCEPDTLVIELIATGPESLDRLEQVLGSRLAELSNEDELVVSFMRADGAGEIFES